MSAWADPFVDGALDVRGDEGGALVVEVRGTLALQGDRGDLRHLDPEGLQGRLLQEGAGARRAGLVHGVVGRDAVGDVGVLGVLTADFEESVHLGIEMDRGRGVGDDFVDDAVGESVQPRDLSARAAHAQTDDADRPRVHLTR